MPQPIATEGTSVVSVSIIDTTSRISNVATSQFMEPPVEGLEYLSSPSLSFLVENKEHGKILFDLGVRKDINAYAPYVTQRLSRLDWHVTVQKSTSEILEENNVGLENISAIVWSHWHWDHVGDPSTFPPTTDLVVGPGFGDAFMPGYPLSHKSPILKADYNGRNLRELNFDTVNLRICGFKAIDFFQDGSFYLLDAPGHAIGHLCGLARTSKHPDTFILMGADACHHPGEIRPSDVQPLPVSVPFYSSTGRPQFCPGSMLEDLQQGRGLTASQPFFRPVGAFHHQEALQVIQNLQRADADENILVVIAHDAYLHGIVEFFPADANDWKAKKWRDAARWNFLMDFVVCKR